MCRKNVSQKCVAILRFTVACKDCLEETTKVLITIQRMMMDILKFLHELRTSWLASMKVDM